MSHIGNKFSDAKPHPRTDFSISNQEKAMGDIWMMFDLDSQRSSMSEYTSFVKFNFTPSSGRHNVYMNLNVSLDHEVVGSERDTKTNVSGNLPSAYIFRDSFGGPIFDFLTDRFSNAHWREWDKFNFNLDDVAARKPDYIIYIIAERDLKNVIWE